MTTTTKLEQSQQLLAKGEPAPADRLLSFQEVVAFDARDAIALQSIWPILARARIQRRTRAAAGRIDLHTHSTSSDGEMTVQQLLCKHFVQGQILIDDHNTIDSLEEARRLVHDHDLELDVFLGIEVICTHECRAFEFHAIAPTLNHEFQSLCHGHRKKWNRACELFVDELARRDDLFSDPAWLQIGKNFSVGGALEPVLERYQQVRDRITSDSQAYDTFLANNQTFDMGNLWQAWGLGCEGDPPRLNHRFFASMRCYALNVYREELGDWFDYESLARRFRDVGCFISHNHPNYWDEDFVGEIRHELQTKWIQDWAQRGVIDALEVWSPPFASRRVPHYWEKVCHDLSLVPMAGTDCHSGREQEFGGQVDNHPEIPPMIFASIAASAVVKAELETEPWAAYSAWRDVLEIDYAHLQALKECQAIVESLATQ
ncbi:MAG: hypothetical protein ABGX16_14420 [Pirellulales bacterium]